MTTAPQTTPDRATVAAKQRRRREVLAAVVGALLAVFALLNLGDVHVNWIVTTAQTPLIVVVALSVLVGMALDRLMIRRKRRRTAAEAAVVRAERPQA